MTEALNNIKRDYPSFNFHDGEILHHKVVNKAKMISCENDRHYMTIHDHVGMPEQHNQRFAVIATSSDKRNIHYVKRFSTEGGLRLYLTSVMSMGI